MTSGDGSLEPTLEFPPIVRPESSPAPSIPRLPALRLPVDLRLSTLALASGLALAFEGFRLAARSSRKRAAARQGHEEPTRITVSYEWTRVTYERRERP